jgi:hypothetical protein
VTDGNYPAAEDQEVELTGVMAEFRTALPEEIDAACRSAAASGAHLLDGRRADQSAGLTSWKALQGAERELRLHDLPPHDRQLVPQHEQLEVGRARSEHRQHSLNGEADEGEGDLPQTRDVA